MQEAWNGVERRMKYNGEERRAEYCPVHNIKCDEIKSIQEDAQKRVPVWVFTIFASAIFIALGWINLEVNNRNDETMKVLEKYFERSDSMFAQTGSVLAKATHALNEVAWNQRTVMKTLELEFQPIPNYQNHKK